MDALSVLIVIVFLFALIYGISVIPIELANRFRRLSRLKLQESEARQRELMQAQIKQQRELAFAKQREHDKLLRTKAKLNYLNQKARNLQIAFQQLPSDPDAKRLRCWAQATQALPVDFRRRQFMRFRRLLLTQIARWLRDQVDIEELLDDLHSITQSLGIAEFEADYLLRQVGSQTQDPPVSESAAFEQQLQRIHSEHQRRIAALNAIQGLDEEIREELIDAETQRYRNQLVRRPEQM